MDFHSLPRKVLQLLCKRNKIHANMTNVAMADALHSLQTVEGLDQILQKTPDRPPNPPRSCRRNSSLISTTPSLNAKSKRAANQELPDSSTLKRNRTLSPRRPISRKKEEDVEQQQEEEEYPTEKVPPFNTLMPCRESSLCLDAYSMTRFNCSVEPIEDVIVQKPVLECSSGVRQNAVTTEFAELAIGGAVECIQVGEERRRSVGIQVDIGDLDNCLLEISTIGDQVPKPAHEDKASADMTVCTNSQNSLEFNQCLDLVKKDQETATSYHLPTDEILDKECVKSLGLQNLQLATQLPEQTPESSNVLSNLGDLNSSQQTALLEIGDPIVESRESDDSIGSLASNCGLLLEGSEGEKRGFVGIHSNHGEGTDMDRENEEPKSGGGARFEIKTEKKSEKKRDLSGLSLRKLRWLCKENKEAIKLETKGECGREEKVHCEEKQSAEKAMSDGLSLRKLKFLYKNKVTNNRSKQGC